MASPICSSLRVTQQVLSGSVRLMSSLPARGRVAPKAACSLKDRLPLYGYLPKATVALASGLMLLTTACHRPPAIASSPVPPPEPLTSDVAIVGPGDTLEVGYFRNTGLQTQARYTIGVSDVLRVDVADHPELSRDRVNVLSDGRISLPVIGSLMAAGRTTELLASTIAAAYEKEQIQQPRVVVAVEERDQRLGGLLRGIGESSGNQILTINLVDGSPIQLPQIRPIAPGQTLEQLREEIRRAYAAEFGNALDVTVNLRRRPGKLVYVLGEVSKPGSVELTPSLGSIAAIASVGGTWPTADLTNVVVVRFNEGGYHQWVLNIEKPLYDTAPAVPDFPLRAGDIIFVPKTGIAELNLVVDQYIRRMLPFSTGLGFGLGYTIGGTSSQ
jgi:polysaccharide biosynthesis/export protein PslD